MKSATVIVVLDGGGMYAQAFPLASECDVAAKKIRDDRTVTVGNKKVPALQGVVVRQNATGAQVAWQFNCVADARREKAQKEAEKAAKAEAEAKAKAEAEAQKEAEKAEAPKE